MAGAVRLRTDYARRQISGPDDWPGNELREKRNGENKVAERFGWLQDAAINVERVRKRMERVKGNSDGKQNIEVRRLVDDADARDEPLKILKEKISVFEEPEHAQIHAHTRDQPATSRALIFCFGHLPAEPEIHRRRGKQKRSKWRIPGAVENVTGGDEQIFPQRPRSDAPVKHDDDYEKDDEGERIKKHGESPIELRCRDEQPIYASHIEADV